MIVILTEHGTLTDQRNHLARLHDHFGRGGDDVLHRLRALRRDAAARAGRGTPADPATTETTSAPLEEQPA